MAINFSCMCEWLAHWLLYWYFLHATQLWSKSTPMIGKTYFSMSPYSQWWSWILEQPSCLVAYSVSIQAKLSGDLIFDRGEYTWSKTSCYLCRNLWPISIGIYNSSGVRSSTWWRIYSNNRNYDHHICIGSQSISTDFLYNRKCATGFVINCLYRNGSVNIL